MRQTPYRPKNNDISQVFTSGVVAVYTQTDVAKPGYQPKSQPTQKGTLAFEEQRLGLQRYYSAKQNQIQVERVIRVPKGFEITNQDIAITQDGKQYRIDLVQAVLNVYPACLDLTLVAYRQKENSNEVVRANYSGTHSRHGFG